MRTVEELAPLVDLMAKERTKGQGRVLFQMGDRARKPWLYDDAYQEGLIAAWRVSQTHPDQSDAYQTAAARNAVVGVLSGRPLTGEDGRKGWQDAHDSAGPIEVESPEGGTVTLGEDRPDWGPVDGFAAVERRADLGPVLDAVRGLSERDRMYVWLRFWVGMNEPEIAEELGTTKEYLNRTWRNRIRPALREAVAA